MLKSNQRLWELFTKKEEYEPPLFDQYQRFPYYLSEHRNIFEPKTSIFLIQNGLKVKYPNNKKFAVCLTHDIDIVYFSILRMAYTVAQTLRKRQMSRSLKILLSGVNKRFNPLWNFTQIMDLEDKYGAKSSFYLLALDKYDLDFNYNIDRLNEELRNIIDNGWEVGLHGGRKAYNNSNEMKKEKERLEKVIGKKVVGYRNHCLTFKVPKTWELLNEAGFKYDATFGYADCVGFRNGMCHPFKPFNLNTNKYINILEIPLTIMDGTLVDYMRLDIKNSWDIIKRLIDTVERHGGVITVLWHNTYMVDEMLELYEEILKYCHNNNAWMTSGLEIWEWWNGNKYLEGY